MNNFAGGSTVLMAVYKNDDVSLLERAVDSVYANTLQPDDFILVVDGPVPQEMLAMITILESKYPIRLLKIPENLGLAKALNAGLKLVSTEWVLRADADDFNLPDRFSLQADAIAASNHTVDLIGAAIQEVDNYGNKLAIRKTVETQDEIYHYAAYRNPFNHMTVAYRTELVRRCGGYPDIYLKEDYALWATMISSGARVMNLPEILVLATTGKEMYKRRGGLRYAVAEIALQRHLVSARLKSVPAALFQGLIRSFVFLLPPSIRGILYRKLLRSS